MVIGLLHNGIECLEILRILALNDLPGKIKIFLVMGVSILAVVCFDPVMSGFRKEDVCCFEVFLDFCYSDDPVCLFLPPLAVGKVSAIMDETDIISVYVLPCPV